MNDNKFWLGITGIIVAGVVAIAVSINLYWRDHNAKIVEMIGKGVDPIEAMCAMQDDYGNHPVCLVRATKKD